MSDFNDDVLRNVVEGAGLNGLGGEGVGGIDVVKLDWGEGEEEEQGGCSKQRWYGGDDDDNQRSAAFALLDPCLQFDLVLAADCCYEPDHPRLLCRFSPPPPPPTLQFPNTIAFHPPPPPLPSLPPPAACCGGACGREVCSSG
jgi:hypothetical protein